MPGTVLNALHTLFYSVLPAILCSGRYYPHFTDERTEVEDLGQSHIRTVVIRAAKAETCNLSSELARDTPGHLAECSSVISAHVGS